ncbi:MULTISPECIES: hypothetical protein [Enterobacter]|uniref:hypothetical protein n=1 Tax=Enterobacter TaxID=547 RepID=UPI0007AE1A72|nr:MULTISPECIES: hypothetical protein [Enterobacter]AMZ77773.1 hypothetical protein A4308_12505 [Enterobacter sp. ODB01]EKS6337603.1 hypothetical protein [Enterobacter hormaechei]VAL43378.1 Uncharacterised protein [Enterobacter kobei]
MTLRHVFILACGIVLLSGCAASRLQTKAPASAPVTLLDALSQQVSTLRLQASQGNRQAEDALMAMVSGQGVQVLMSRRADSGGS